MQKTSTAVSMLVPMVALGVPIFDTLFSMLRRTLERRNLFSPDRGHVHHRLIDMGITHRRAVMLLYGVSVLLMVSAIAIALGRSWESGAALLVASVVLTGLIRFVGYFEYVRSKRRVLTRSHDSRVRLLRRLVPAFTADVAAAHTEEQLWSLLCTFAERAECSMMTLEVRSALRRWPANTTEPEPERVVLARFPITLHGRLEFGFGGDLDLTPQADILLQLAADAVEAALAGCEPLEDPSAARLALAPPKAGGLLASR
jgi:UDP-GlcNAc:undecaprenyl-phosphate GlcNAc-1-phosphate transferase